MAGFNELSIVWSEIQKYGKIRYKKLEEEIGKKNPALASKLKDILSELYEMYLIDYEHDEIVRMDILNPAIFGMPCSRCEKIKICRINARNDPFKCEKFVKWFLTNFTEY